MNRQMKRMMQRQGQVGSDGVTPRQPTRAPTRTAPRERIGPGEYVRQVRAELRKVAWPTRGEVIRYSIIVLVALLLLTGLIFGLDFVFAKGVIWLFE